MAITEFKNNLEYKKALAYVNHLFDKKVKKGTLEGDRLKLLLLAIKKYEDKNYPVNSQLKKAI